MSSLFLLLLTFWMLARDLLSLLSGIITVVALVCLAGFVFVGIFVVREARAAELREWFGGDPGRWEREWPDDH